MRVTENLQNSFDKNRKINESQLDVLLELGVHPEFAEKCIKMFREIWATTNEILSQKDEISAVNDELYKLDLKRERLHRSSIVNLSSEKLAA